MNNKEFGKQFEQFLNEIVGNPIDYPRKFEVLQEDINEGNPSSPFTCPLAYALYRTTEGKYSIGIGIHQANFRKKKEKVVVKLSERLQEYLYLYDEFGHEFKPMTISINKEGEYDIDG